MILSDPPLRRDKIRVPGVYRLAPFSEREARRLHQSFIWPLECPLVEGRCEGVNLFCTGEPVLNADLGGSWRTGQHMRHEPRKPQVVIVHPRG